MSTCGPVKIWHLKIEVITFLQETFVVNNTTTNWLFSPP